MEEATRRDSEIGWLLEDGEKHVVESKHGRKRAGSGDISQAFLFGLSQRFVFTPHPT